jgi:hypothetical protein
VQLQAGQPVQERQPAQPLHPTPQGRRAFDPQLDGLGADPVAPPVTGRRHCRIPGRVVGPVRLRCIHEPEQVGAGGALADRPQPAEPVERLPVREPVIGAERAFSSRVSSTHLARRRSYSRLIRRSPCGNGRKPSTPRPSTCRSASGLPRRASLVCSRNSQGSAICFRVAAVARLT